MVCVLPWCHFNTSSCKGKQINLASFWRVSIWKLLYLEQCIGPTFNRSRPRDPFHASSENLFFKKKFSKVCFQILIHSFLACHISSFTCKYKCTGSGSMLWIAVLEWSMKYVLWAKILNKKCQKYNGLGGKT